MTYTASLQGRPAAPPANVARSPEALAWAFAGLALLLVVGPFLAYPVVLMKWMAFALFAASFNLLLGYAGLMSFGHAAFLAAGSYGAAQTAKAFDLGAGTALLSGTAAALVLGLAFGLVAIRRQGIYFAMITLALAQLVYFYIMQAPWTGGENGIQAVPRGRLFGVIDLADDRQLYVLYCLLFLAALAGMHRLVFSPFGQVLRAIRDNEARATSLGHSPNTYKLTVFVVSAGVAGLAGAMKALLLQFAAPSDAHWMMSGEPVLMTLLGGLGSFFGPLLGAGTVVAMQNYLAQLGAWVVVVQGLIFIVAVLAFRDGLLGTLRRATGVRL